ncbi:MAG: hypothetical protein BWY31_02026 [Lentisphaerae bacterium ADurb.Bin242]|nr:MAG: hypothetical protein BWY31_02026 [Lentisphaerae bacterium ADurb.Bin242]
MLKFIPVIVALWAALPFPAEALELVRDSKLLCYILTEPDPPPPIRFAASELAAYIGKTAGLPPCPVSDREIRGLLPLRLRLLNEKSIGDEGYRISVTGKGVEIGANTGTGVLYGTFAFIEKQLGVRWFYPGEEYCPVSGTLAIQEGVLQEKPFFTTRTIQHTHSARGRYLETWNWIVRNRMQLVTDKGSYSLWRKELEERGAVVSAGGHTLVELVSDRLFEKHPEYFALVNGKRIRQVEIKDRRVVKWLSQPCLTHPEVQKMVVDGICKSFETDPKTTQYLIGNNDVPVWCECPDCRKDDNPDEKVRGIVTTRFYKFINRVAAEVHKKHPEAKLLAWAYQSYQDAPLGVKPDPSLEIRLCDHYRCYRHDLGDTSCSRNERFRKLYSDWSRFGNPLVERGYQETLLDTGSYFYLPIESVMARDIQYFKKHSVSGLVYLVTTPEGNFPKDSPYLPMLRERWRCQWQSVYVTARLLWNPDQDYRSVLEEISSRYYGPAWKVMKKYRELLTELYLAAPGHIVYLQPGTDIGRCLSKKGSKEQLLQYLADAGKAAAGDPAVSRRIDREAEYFRLLWLAASEKYQAALNSTVSAAWRNGEIAIDGNLNEPSWQNTTVTGNFVRNASHTKGALTKQTHARVLFDSDFIYFGIEAFEDAPEKILVAETKRDGNVFNDNSIEIFLADPASVYRRFAHWIINSKDAVYDEFYDAASGKKDPGFNFGIESKTVVLKDRIVTEVRIPRKVFSTAPYMDAPWRINLCRNRRLKDGTQELSSWSDGSYGNPETFNPVLIILKNGSFEEVSGASGNSPEGEDGPKNPKDQPLFWSRENRPGECGVMKGDAFAGERFLRLRKEGIHQKIILPEDFSRDLSIRFSARGSGKIAVNMYLYDRKTGKFKKSVPVQSFELRNKTEWESFSVNYPVRGTETLRIAFVVPGEADLDDIRILPVERADLLN